MSQKQTEMTWFDDHTQREARTPEGYRIRWADNKFGTWFNAWSPCGRNLASNYRREICKAACEKHRAQHPISPQQSAAPTTQEMFA